MCYNLIAICLLSACLFNNLLKKLGKKTCMLYVILNMAKIICF